ncbi:MAG: tRNA (adenosine(37)-N6)-threonylcarbamoyltransferase complex transferase subunit TsaD [Bradymonadaceae bacterium]|nr:tRNA (adenosine(37)-N6)-threonylcarbamoyltransferase complex transferase subunit TsaD [Lujinxingiaceae bacterium]
MLVLTIESSCDETSAAVIVDGRRMLSNAVASQIPIHRRFGGVVPELASRNHIRDIHTVINDALAEAQVGLGEIEGFGVTSGPGLVGSLLVGIETAKGLAWTLKRPCVGLNHLEGHLTAVMLELENQPSPPAFPYLGLIVSGGHSDIYVVHGFGDYELLGRTRDDAAGEAFDKVAKMLGLPYPGGVEIDRLAQGANPKAIAFPRPMWTRKHLDFSFSGLKTAVATHLATHGIPTGLALADLCASFQQAVVDVLVMKSVEAARSRSLERLIISGGVACNSMLRQQAQTACQEAGLELFVAPASLCTDNAAMLGPIAEFYLSAQQIDGFHGHDIRAQANMALGTSRRETSRSYR